MQMFWKQRQTFLNPKYKGLGLWAMPNIFCFSILFRSSRRLPMLSCFLEFYQETEENIQLLFNFPFGGCFSGFYSVHHAEGKLVNLLYVFRNVWIQMADVYCIVQKSKKSTERRNADLGIPKTYRKCKRNCNFLIGNASLYIKDWRV
jgi:hypothetical protein